MQFLFLVVALLVPSFGQSISNDIPSETARPSFQWMNHCGYKGSDLDTKYDVNSLVQCGEACYNRKDCNYFTFASPNICALKKIGNLKSAVATQGSICGMFPNRIPNSASTCQWQTSEDGLYQWAEDCNISNWGSFLSVTFGPSVIPTMTACAEQCKANPKCNNFFFQPNNGKQCFLYNSPSLTSELKFISSSRRTVGVITERKFNVEFLPAKQQQCEVVQKVSTTTETDTWYYV